MCMKHGVLSVFRRGFEQSGLYYNWFDIVQIDVKVLVKQIVSNALYCGHVSFALCKIQHLML